MELTGRYSLYNMYTDKYKWNWRLWSSFWFIRFTRYECTSYTDACLYAYCTGMLAKMNALESKVQQEIGDILGKANQQANYIYKQFHTIFHQWSSLSLIGGDNNKCGTIPKNNDGLAKELEKEYGGFVRSKSDGNLKGSGS